MSAERSGLGRELREAVASAQTGSQRRSQESAFRARMEERLRAVERELADLKGRTNALFLVIASSVLAQVLLRVAG